MFVCQACVETYLIVEYLNYSHVNFVSLTGYIYLIKFSYDKVYESYV